VFAGWGISPPDGNPKGDAIKNAKTPVMDKFEKEDPFCELEAHGLAVGLPDGLMGNSEGILQFVGVDTDDSRTFEHWGGKSCLAGTLS
jgi:bisphosphoglycerate-independent phosphoglycerate mutase (AlkP superfamily)